MSEHDYWCRHGINHGTSELKWCLECTHEIAEMQMVKADTGPWHVEVWSARGENQLDRVVLQSDDFRHDVALIITGDFWDIEQKKGYAQLLADKLNGKS
jgi:hypothetical protein